MSLDQKRARWFGVLYLITFVTSIPAALLYRPVLDDPVGYIAGAGHDKRILFGALLELFAGFRRFEAWTAAEYRRLTGKPERRRLVRW